MKTPTLVILAAGMGSRYGGLKQLDPVGSNGEIIIDYSVYDALCAGFEKIIFVIRKDFEDEFDVKIGQNVKDRVSCHYAFQDINDLPDGFTVPEGRVKPWGTGHALMAAAEFIEGEPFAVINADDYYGKKAYHVLFEFLTNEMNYLGDNWYGLCLWPLRKTLSDHGSVSRGVCEVSPENELISITEIKKIFRDGKHARYTLDDNPPMHALSGDRLVSMNFFGFPYVFLERIREGFSQFLQKGMEENPMKCEYLLSEIVAEHMDKYNTAVRAIPINDQWFGITNKEDRELVAKAMNKLVDEGMYPSPLWDSKI